MKPRTILILSLVGNLSLGAAAIHFFHAESSMGKAENEARASNDPKPRKKESTKSQAIGRKMLATNIVEDEFTWRLIEAADYKDYIANLRAVDCPEETIRDIIVADVNKLYAPRLSELRGGGGDYKYWKRDGFSWNSKDGYERQKKLRAMEKEKSALLVELLGVDPAKEKQKELGYVDYRERNFSFLPEEKKSAAMKIQEEFEERRQEIYRNGIVDDEDQKKLKQNYNDQLAELAKVLTTQELQEYDLRASQTATQLRYDLDVFEPTEDEFRQIYALRKAREDDLAPIGDPDDKPAMERRKQANAEIDEQIKTQLGPERFAEYQRAQDYSYKELTRLTSRLDLPHQTAADVYDMRKIAEEQVKNVHENKDLTKEQRNELARQLREETEKAVKEKLGESGFKKYKTRGGWWMSNLGPGSKN